MYDFAKRLVISKYYYVVAIPYVKNLFMKLVYSCIL